MAHLEQIKLFKRLITNFDRRQSITIVSVGREVEIVSINKIEVHELVLWIV